MGKDKESWLAAIIAKAETEHAAIVAKQEAENAKFASWSQGFVENVRRLRELHWLRAGMIAGNRLYSDDSPAMAAIAAHKAIHAALGEILGEATEREARIRVERYKAEWMGTSHAMLDDFLAHGPDTSLMTSQVFSSAVTELMLLAQL